jgi:hypothetical protein
MEEKMEDINTASEKKLQQLKHILYLLQSNLEEFKEEVDRSCALLQIGEKTEFARSIEKRLSDPLGEFSDISDKIDQEVKGIIKSMVKNFFNRNNALLDKVFVSKTSLNHLHYSIILKEDNIDNRNAIFEFLNRYDLLDMANKYPVYFQFIPTELAHKINSIEELTFA